MTTPIEDLIDLPERVHSGDFVLKLTEGVLHPEKTLEPYVVTEQIAACFDRALAFIKSAIEAKSSKATFLDGSFGSGKSHFMAVLHLLLQQHPAARAKAGLEEVVTRHNPWLDGKKFLLVPYHLIGQKSLDSAILGGYVDRVRQLHPDAPLPAVYRSEGLLRDAEDLRRNLGDEAFFSQLNQARPQSESAGSGWGDLERRDWDAASFEQALAAPDERGDLVNALIGTFFKSYGEVVRGEEEAFVSLDHGLETISRHARDLGYDALVLFLDELILWLATHATEHSFLNRESSKVSKLVEAEKADRPIPIVSFVARQRDLRELVGDQVTGAEELGFVDTLKWWEARFDTLTLEDRNLPEIAARRVLKPKNEAARQLIEQAWEQTEAIRREVFEVLLTPHADRQVFRKVYPFSPALVETLVAVSSVLQRERTALKLMLQLLVDQRRTLELGQIVPVGDLFDVIASGDEPFTEGMRIHFENARRLYHKKLLPMLETEHKLQLAEVRALPHDDPRAQAFRADDRLLKTLLIAALAPEVEVLKNLNSARLAALNHGSIRSPIPGRERQEVLRRMRPWAGQVGEIKIGEESDPVIKLQLTGVDVESILANAQATDSQGNRRRKIRELLFEALRVDDSESLFLDHEILWRGTRRRFEVVFDNVRKMTAETLAASGRQRKVVIDFPFDEAGHTPADDVARLEEFRQAEPPSRTLVWLPAFLSPGTQRDLGTLVRIDAILRSDESFRGYAAHLSSVEQTQARDLLRNQQSQLRHRLIASLEGAYGLRRPERGTIDEAHRPEQPFQSLDPSFVPRPPDGGTLQQAFEHLLAQMLDHQYPAHPRFSTSGEIKIGELRRIHAEVVRALRTQDGRIAIDRPLRKLMREVAVPLRLGEMGDTHFVAGRHWYDHLQRHGDGEMTVGKLRARLDEPEPAGLSRPMQNLIIHLFADQSNRVFLRHGGPVAPSFDKLEDDLELREEALPDDATWQEARQRAEKILGQTLSPLRNVSNATAFSENLVAWAREHREPCQTLCDRLERRAADLGLDPTDWPRFLTASATWNLCRQLVQAEKSERIAALAGATLATSPSAMATSWEKAGAVNRALESTRWDLFEGIARLEDERAAAARGVRQALVEVLRADEYVESLAPRLAKLENDAIRLLAPPEEPRRPGAAGPALTGAALQTAGEIVEVESRDALDAPEVEAVMRALAERLAADPALRLDLSWKLRRREEG